MQYDFKFIHVVHIKNSLKDLQKQFREAEPYQHIVIGDFFLPHVAEEMLLSFPSEEVMQQSSAFSGIAESKKQLSKLRSFPSVFQGAFAEIMHPAFLALLSEITNINPLLSDSELTGGGLHQGGNGSFLDVHADFNLDRKTGKYRRLNILVYFNRDWKDEYGGQLEMWNHDMKRCIQIVSPQFNRCVIFATTKISFYGYKKIQVPPGVTRKSMAAYYYSNEPPSGEGRVFHNTLFQARPGELRNRVLYPFLRSRWTQKIARTLGKWLFPSQY